jgi:hypothetical protein
VKPDLSQPPQIAPFFPERPLRHSSDPSTELAIPAAELLYLVWTDQQMVVKHPDFSIAQTSARIVRRISRDYANRSKDRAGIGRGAKNSSCKQLLRGSTYRRYSHIYAALAHSDAAGLP